MASNIRLWLLIILLTIITSSSHLYAQADSLSYPQIFIGLTLLKPSYPILPGFEITSTIYTSKNRSLGLAASYYSTKNKLLYRFPEEGGTLSISGKAYYDYWAKHNNRTTFGFRQSFQFSTVNDNIEVWRHQRSYREQINIDLKILRAATYITYGTKYPLRPYLNLYWDIGYGLKYVLKRKHNIPSDATTKRLNNGFIQSTLFNDNSVKSFFLRFSLEFLVNGRSRHKTN